MPKTEIDPVTFQRQGVFVLSSHPGGKGLLYTNEPYKLYENGNVIQEGLTDDKASIVYDYKPDATYKVETLSGHVFNLETHTPTQDRQEILARSLGQMGYRYTGQDDTQEATESILTGYLRKKQNSSTT